MIGGTFRASYRGNTVSPSASQLRVPIKSSGAAVVAGVVIVVVIQLQQY